MDECNVCDNDDVGICNDCNIALCSEHNFSENHSYYCNYRKIDQFLYTR